MSNVTQKDKRCALVSDLLDTLNLIPNVDPATAMDALEVLQLAAENYRNSMCIVDIDGRRHRPKIADARTQTQRLKRTLLKALDQRDRLPSRALSQLQPSHSNSKIAESHPPGFRRRILQLVEDVDHLQVALDEQPNKEPDADRAYVALEVALIFRDVLKIRPVSTRDRGINVSSSPKRATYAHVLRKVLAIAGLHNVDIGPLIDMGLDLLNDPELPHNLKQ